MHREDIPKTAIITPFGLYDFLRTPFGLKNAAQAFQRSTDTVRQKVASAVDYLDDVLVASIYDSEHMAELRTGCDLLRKLGLIIRLQKCMFGQTTIGLLAPKS